MIFLFFYEIWMLKWGSEVIHYFCYHHLQKTEQYGIPSNIFLNLSPKELFSFMIKNIKYCNPVVPHDSYLCFLLVHSNLSFTKKSTISRNCAQICNLLSISGNFIHAELRHCAIRFVLNMNKVHFCLGHQTIRLLFYCILAYWKIHGNSFKSFLSTAVIIIFINFFTYKSLYSSLYLKTLSGTAS